MRDPVTPDFGTLRRRASKIRGDLARLLLGQFLSQIGDWLAYIALPLLVLDWTGQPILASFSLLFELLPAILVAPFAGVVADYYDRRNILIISDLVRAGLLVVMVLTNELWLLLAAAFSVGAVSQFFGPALAAVLPNLVDERSLLKFNSLRQSLNTGAMVAGPAVGGIALGLVGARGAFVVDAVSFLISALLLVTIRMRGLPTNGVEKFDKSFHSDMLAGFNYLIGQKVALGAVTIVAATILGAAALNALEPVFAREISANAELAFGMMVTFWGLGMVVGSGLLMRVGHHWSWRRLFLGGSLLLGVSTMGVATSVSLATVLAMLAVGGIGNALTAILLTTILQRLVPDILRGRVFAFSTLAIQSAQVLGMMTWGALAQYFPTRSLFAVASLLSLGAFLAGHALWPYDIAPTVYKKGVPP
ncbi:MAG: MFS transporter [Armatimonadota bacterium]|nr:MFS transporter [Armatimonadota bacterium]MDR7450762.1 MFS transporter [Armatimonadota bacterium]MDR7466118.1 MFS transporter [Armatimonadota bacterium]MDR7493846.1 MFS transporter [Armatimonadota bacterium]MDR7498994.1 MFS transporter [Armatimonadota bacterium]